MEALAMNVVRVSSPPPARHQLGIARAVPTNRGQMGGEALVLTRTGASSLSRLEEHWGDPTEGHATPGKQSWTRRSI